MADIERPAPGRTVVLAGGGTGGHVYPALAMGAALQTLGHSLVYLGDARRLEGRVVPARGIPFHPVPAVQFPRSGLLAKASFGVGLLRSIVHSRKLLKNVRAEVVLGVGGYVSAPPVLAAWTLGIPTAVHEANVTPGLANRLCARVADLVLLTYEGTRARLKTRGQVELVGCPVNRAILEGDAAAAAQRYGLALDQPTLLIVGGSLGAETINTLAVALAKDPNRTMQLAVVTGPKYEAQVKEQLGELPPGVGVIGYEDRMADAYALASMVLCRAGSSTLAEVTALGLPSILVPSPNVTDNHQEGNARGLEAVGAAVVVVERDLDVDDVVARVRALMADPDALKQMGEAAQGLARLDTAERVAGLVDGLLR